MLNFDGIQIHQPGRLCLLRNTILAMYSGGLDSVGMLYRLLTTTGNPIHVHHCHLVNEEGRWKAEAAAVSSTLHWFRGKGYSGRISYSESVFKYDSLRGGFLFDADIGPGLMAGYMVSYSNGRIVKTAVGKTATDDTAGSASIIARGQSIYQLFTTVPKIYPLENLTKLDVYKMLPPDLRDLTWSCRTPVNGTFDRPQPCGLCKPCRQMTAIRQAC